MEAKKNTVAIRLSKTVANQLKAMKKNKEISSMSSFVEEAVIKKLKRNAAVKKQQLKEAKSTNGPVEESRGTE